MKHLIIAPIFLFISLTSHAQSVAINTDGSSANASALLDVKSTTKGLLIPRMTTAQRTAVATPAKGLIVFDITSNGLWFHNGTAWIALSSGSATNYWTAAGSNIYNNTAGNVGLTTLNISATQELSKLITEQNKKIKALEEGVNRLSGATSFTVYTRH